MPKCPICNREFEKIISLSLHYRKIHKRQAKQLYIELHCNGIEPTCGCGCGESVKYLGVMKDFRKYARGHSIRIHNNWGHNKKAQEKSLKTRRKMIEEGTWKPFFLKETGEHWGKGLTKETDERVAKMAQTIIENPEEIEKRQERMRRNRLDGTIPTLYGKDHSQWKGGISSLNQVCRSNKKLFENWIYPKLVNSGFKCQKCGYDRKLEVHHDEEKFSEILRKIAKKHNWNFLVTEQLEIDNPEIKKLKDLISDEIVKYHIKNNVSGIVLCQKCHGKIHPNLNF